jgi:hypothetical protein
LPAVRPSELQRAVGNPEPACGARETSILLAGSDPYGNLFRSPPNFFESRPEKQSALDRTLEVQIQPNNVLWFSHRALLWRDIADGDCSIPHIAVHQPRDNLTQIAHIAGILSPKEITLYRAV